MTRQRHSIMIFSQKNGHGKDKKKFSFEIQNEEYNTITVSKIN